MATSGIESPSIKSPLEEALSLLNSWKLKWNDLLEYLNNSILEKIINNNWIWKSYERNKEINSKLVENRESLLNYFNDKIRRLWSDEYFQWEVSIRVKNAFSGARKENEEYDEKIGETIEAAQNMWFNIPEYSKYSPDLIKSDIIYDVKVKLNQEIKQEVDNINKKIAYLNSLS